MLEVDNHANQCNPNNDEYWHSRGYDERPDDWGGSNHNIIDSDYDYDSEEYDDNYKNNENKKKETIEIHPTHYLNDIYDSLIEKKNPNLNDNHYNKLYYSKNRKCYYTDMYYGSGKSTLYYSKDHKCFYTCINYDTDNRINILNYNISRLCNTNKSIKIINFQHDEEKETNNIITSKIIASKIKNNPEEYNLNNNIIILKYYECSGDYFIIILHNNLKDINKIRQNISEGLDKLISIEKNIINCWKFQDISLNLYNSIDRYGCQHYDDWDVPNDTCWYSKRHTLLEKYQ